MMIMNKPKKLANRCASRDVDVATDSECYNIYFGLNHHMTDPHVPYMPIIAKNVYRHTYLKKWEIMNKLN
jgi:hypothetical protein